MYFQPRISVAQEEVDITEMIDKEYERNQQEERDYYEQYNNMTVQERNKKTEGYGKFRPKYRRDLVCH